MADDCIREAACIVALCLFYWYTTRAITTLCKRTHENWKSLWSCDIHGALQNPISNCKTPSQTAVSIWFHYISLSIFMTHLPGRCARWGCPAERHLQCDCYSKPWSRVPLVPFSWTSSPVTPSQPCGTRFHRLHVLNEQVFNYAADVFCLCLCFLHKSWAPTRERKFHSLFAIINIIQAAS